MFRGKYHKEACQQKKKDKMEDKLHQACSDGKVEEVRKLLQKLLRNSQININCQNPSSKTPFYIVCEKGHIEVVKLLLNDQRIADINKVDPNKANKYDQTPFFIACGNGHIEIVKLLLNDQKIDINKANDDGVTPFSIACEEGYIDIVKLLLNDKRVDINKAKNDGTTPLYVACRWGYIEIVKLLLNDQRVDVNKANNGGETPFWIACYYGHIEIVKLLLNNNIVDINKANKNEETPFYIACQKGHIEIVKLLLNDNRVDINKPLNDGSPPFWYVCYYGHIEIVKLLLNDERVDINKARNDGATPFLMACINGRTEVVKCLRESGREIDINTTYFGRTGLYFARQKGNTDIVELIESFQQNQNETRIKSRKEFDEKQLWEVCLEGKVEEVQTLLQNSQINTNWQDPKYSSTPFYIACGYGHIEIVKLLLNDNRVGINKADNNGKTPFYIACQFGHIEIVKLLLNDQKIDVNKGTNNGETPFYVACKGRRIEIVKLLLNDERVDINNTNTNTSPFYIACENGHIETVKLLLNDQRVDINKANDDGVTPFMIACYQGHIEIIQLLLNDQRVDINQADKKGIAPFYIACGYGHIEIVKLLLNDNRADIHKVNNDGWTPFHIACENGYIEIVKLLLNSQTVDINKENIYGGTPFYLTCQNRYIEIVKLLLSDNRVDINKTNNDGETPFYIACQEGHIEIVALLLNDERVDIHKARNTDASPFSHSCYWGKTEVVKYMLESGREIDINRKDKYGKTGLDWARERRNMDIVELIESFQKYPNETKLRKELGLLGEEELWQACRDGEVEELQKLLQNSQVNTNWKNQNQKLGEELWQACRDGKVEELQKLLQNSQVNTNWENQNQTPFWIACLHGHIEIVKLLLRDERVDINKVYHTPYDNGSNAPHPPYSTTPFWIACGYKHIDIVKLLLNDTRVDVNKANKDGETPFYISCQYGHIEIVKYMLESGREIDINRKDKYGKTGLDWARERRNMDIVELIESFQKNPNETRTKLRKELGLPGEEELWQACRDGEVEELQKLLQKKQIDINWQNNFLTTQRKFGAYNYPYEEHGWTPFFIACEKGHIEVVKLLVSNQKVDINYANNGRETSLNIACKRGHIEIVKLLLNDQRVDVNKADNGGITPFHSACRNGHLEIVKLFINDQRVDVNKAENGSGAPLYPLYMNFGNNIVSYTGSGQAPFSCACYCGHTEVVKYMLESGREIDINRKDKYGKTGLDWARERRNMDIVELIESFQKRSKKSTYEIEYNEKLYILKTKANILSEFENDVRSKLKLEGNLEFDLEFWRKGKYFILDDIEDLEEGMTIKVSITTQSQLNSSLSFSNLTISESTYGNNECWWNTRPNEKTKWEEKGYIETKYLRYLLRDNRQNVVDNGNEYLKKLEILITFFGGDMNQVNKAYVLFNEKLFDSFQHQRSSLFNQQRANPTNFKKDDWQNGNDFGQKFKFYHHYSKMAERFDWNHSKFLHAIPMIHGTSETALHEICQTGLAATGATDVGFYGQGMYFSSSLFYTSKYAKDSPDGKPFIICMITPGNVYPVTESPFIEGPIPQENPDGFIRRPCKLGYQSHYTLVDKRKFNDAYPITGNIDGNAANELVVFDKAQVLPLFAIYTK